MAPDELSAFHAARGTIYLITKSIITSLIGGILYIIIARTLPEISDLGLFQGAQSLIAILIVLSGSGLARAAIRSISFDMGSGNVKRADETYPTVFILGIITSTIVSVIAFFFADSIARVFFHANSYSLLVQVSSVDAFFMTMTTFTISLLYAMQRFRTAFIISIINILLKLVISVILLLQIGRAHV